MNLYEERMAPLFSQMLLQRECEQHEILREASDRLKTDPHALARPAEDYVRFERAAQELKALHGAYHRIKTQRYGKCAQCGQAIDLLRLNAYPTDPYCLACDYKRQRSARTQSQTSAG